MAVGDDLLVDLFDRVRESVHAALEGLAAADLTRRVGPEANTVAWLVWHLTRIQDDHVADLAGLEQVWLAEGWAERFGLPLPPHATGFGHGREEVAAVDVPADLLLGYHDAVHDRTAAYLRGLDEAAYDEVVDTSWDPPVTRAVRLVSVVADDLQHAGQAAFVRGMLERRAP